MPPDDDMWGAINDLRDGQREMLVRQGRIESMLSERCEARLQRLRSVEAEVAKHRGEIQGLREHRSFSRGQQAALVAIGSMLAGILGGIAGQVVPHFLGR